MKITKLTALLAMVVGVFVVAGLVFAMDHEVNVVKKDGVGSYLTDAKGMTLYMFKKDTAGKSACEGPCVGNWPIYYRETVAGKDGLDAKNFSSIDRPDGKKQTTYKGMPLYLFVGDKKAGDTNGQGLKDVWYVAAP